MAGLRGLSWGDEARAPLGVQLARIAQVIELVFLSAITLADFASIGKAAHQSSSDQCHALTAFFRTFKVLSLLSEVQT